jgi:hypothetical protein
VVNLVIAVRRISHGEIDDSPSLELRATSRGTFDGFISCGSGSVKGSCSLRSSSLARSSSIGMTLTDAGG